MHTVIPVVLGRLDYRLRIYTPFEEEASRLKSQFETKGGIRLNGILSGEPCAPDFVTTDPSKAARDADMVLMVLPAFAHGSVMRDLAPHLKNDVIVGAMPARSGLEYQICSILEDSGLTGFTVFGLQTLPWACRIQEFGASVEVLGVKEAVGLASIPREQSSFLAPFFTELLDLPIFPMNNMLELSLANVGQIIHPGIMYGLFRNYSGKPFSDSSIPLFYNGVTEEIANVLEALSDEIMKLKKMLQSLLDESVSFDHVLPVKKWLLDSYADKIENDSTLSSAFKTNRAYCGLKAPVRKLENNAYIPDFQSRYLTEDVPTGLVVTAGLARLVNVKTPVIDQVVSEVSRWMGKDYLSEGTLGGENIEETRVPQNFGIHNYFELRAFISR